MGAVRQQAITWANVDLDPCRHMTSLGHNELIESECWSVSTTYVISEIIENAKIYIISAQ